MTPEFFCKKSENLSCKLGKMLYDIDNVWLIIQFNTATQWLADNSKHSSVIFLWVKEYEIEAVAK